MKFTKMTNAVKHGARVTKRFLHKNGPKIATVASTIASIGGTVWACKKTVDVQPKIKQYREERAEVTDKKDLRKSYINEAGYLVKEYAGPAVSIVAGEVLKVGAVRSLYRTVGELSFGIAALQSQVNSLKKDIAAEVGEERAEEITRGVEELDETCEPNIYQSKIKGLSPYAVIFDENHPWWKEDPLYRYQNFYLSQCHLNDLLNARSDSNSRRRAVVMNEIYEATLYKDTELGTHSGWCKNVNNRDDVDNYIEFIFVDPETGMRITDFSSGITKPVYIDFNVDYGYVTQFMEVC